MLARVSVRFALNPNRSRGLIASAIHSTPLGPPPAMLAALRSPCSPTRPTAEPVGRGVWCRQPSSLGLGSRFVPFHNMTVFCFFSPSSSASYGSACHVSFSVLFVLPLLWIVGFFLVRLVRCRGGVSVFVARPSQEYGSKQGGKTSLRNAEGKARRVAISCNRALRKNSGQALDHARGGRGPERGETSLSASDALWSLTPETHPSESG